MFSVGFAASLSWICKIADRMAVVFVENVTVRSADCPGERVEGKPAELTVNAGASWVAELGSFSTTTELMLRGVEPVSVIVRVCGALGLPPDAPFSMVLNTS